MTNAVGYVNVDVTRARGNADGSGADHDTIRIWIKYSTEFGNGDDLKTRKIINDLHQFTFYRECKLHCNSVRFLHRLCNCNKNRGKHFTCRNTNGSFGIIRKQFNCDSFFSS